MWIFAIICLGDNMKCPNCGKNIKRRHCMFCGYILDTGYFTEKSKKGEVTLLDTYLGYDYDKIVRNKNWLSTLLLGPLYVSMKGFIFHGIGLFFLDSFLFYCCWLFNAFFPLPGFSGLLNLILIIVNRTIWMTIDNMIYIYLLDKKLDIIMKENPNNYRELIDKESRRHSDILCLLITIFILAIILLLLFIYYFS